MEPFLTHTSTLVPLPAAHVDTDQLTPARFLRSVRGDGGYGEILLYDWRFDEAGNERPDFVLNRPERRGATILLAGENFGCGSSRETAVWALVEYGFRAVISTSFGDIFRNNSLKNGLLPVEVDRATSDALFDLAADPAAEVTLDLEKTELRRPGAPATPFPVDAFSRRCLMRGLDQLGYLIDRHPAIRAYETRHPATIDTRAVLEG